MNIHAIKKHYNMRICLISFIGSISLIGFQTNQTDSTNETNRAKGVIFS